MNTRPAAGLGNLAVIGNCQVSGLLDETGRLIWACLPRPDADPVFCALLDDVNSDRGVFALEMLHGVQAEQQYLHNTAIVETRLTDAQGNIALITDFCPRFRQNGRVFRPSTLVRIVEPLQGKPTLRLRFCPMSDYGSKPVALTAGSHHLRFTLHNQDYRLTTEASLTALTGAQMVTLDRPLAFILAQDAVIDQQPLVLARSWRDQTIEYWSEWVRSLAIPFEWQKAVIRAAISLKLCTFEDTGAVLAALTTSLPESADSGRNWDYRYCWLRDSYFVIQALNRLGATRTMEAYLHFIGNVVVQSGDGQLQPAYAISGAREVPESVVHSLPGFQGMGPVRVGNAAAAQCQNDVYGAVVLAVSQSFYDQRLNAPGDQQLFEQLEALGAHAIRYFEQPDAGPWEFRGISQVHTFSAVMCWAACDRLARIAAQLAVPERAAHWRGHAERLRAKILVHSWNQARNCLVSQFAGSEVDATLLLLPELGFIAATDPRFLATLDVIERELRVDDLVYRYRHVDDFGPPKNAFTVCSFWYVNALAAVGRLEEARQIYSSLLQRRNALGLFSEDIDPATGAHWGNYPQTYSMVGIISSALRLSRSWEDAL